MHDPDDFPAVLQAARGGDGEALTTLYRRTHPRVLRFVRVLEPGEAEDLASDTWLDLVGALARFEGDEHALVALALTIARRRVVDLRRRRARRKTTPAEPEVLLAHAGRGDTEEDAMARLDLDAAIERLRGLPPDQAEVVLLRVIGGLSVQEVARIVGKRSGTIRVLQHRGLRALARTEPEPRFSERGVTP